MEITEEHLRGRQFIPVHREGESPVYINMALSCILIKDGELYIPYFGINVLLRDISQLQPCKRIYTVEQLDTLIEWIAK